MSTASLLAVGLLVGISVGVALTLTFTTASLPKTFTMPMYWNTASLFENTHHRAGKLTMKRSKSAATIESIDSIGLIGLEGSASSNAVAAAKDSATNYLLAAKNLPAQSHRFLGQVHSGKLQQPNWTWKALLTDTITNKHPSIQRTALFSLPKNKPAAMAKPNKVSQAELLTPLTKPAPQSELDKKFGKTRKERLVVALDPGHGGTDPGSEAHNGLIEKELTLDMANRVALFLSEIENVDVVMTRTTDTGMSRQKRVDKIKAVNADVVVSLHFNHLPQRNINLVETFYADRHNIEESLEKQNKRIDSVNLDFTSASRNLAHIMHRKVYNEVSSVNKETVDAGVKQDTLFVLTRSFTPGVLLELTCISNPGEAERLESADYRNQMAASIADGLRDYLLEEHSHQFGELLAKLDS